jgi:hypothetical protein
MYLLIILSVCSSGVSAIENDARPFMEIDAGTNTGGGGKSTTKQADDTIADVVKRAILEIFSLSESNETSPRTTPDGSTSLSPTPSIIPIDGKPYAGNFKVYRQCNYQNVVAIKATKKDEKDCTLCNMGCGISSAAMILATLVDQTIDPKFVMDKYKEKGEYMSCNGTDIKAAKNIMQDYGLTTSDYLFNYGKGEGAHVKLIADDVRPYLKSGWFVFVLAEFKPNGGGGHFFVLTDIDENNIVTSFDPYYEPDSSSMPINYIKRDPYPFYRAGFAVKRPL